jgi:hypothetical protein
VAATLSGSAAWAADQRALATEGYILLRGAIPPPWVTALQAAFDDGIVPASAWPVPREGDWVHSLIDRHALVQQLCRLPALIAHVQATLRSPFFLAQVEGREPAQGNRPQPLHRDGAGEGGRYMAAMLWLDPFDAANGATQVVPGSHRTGPDQPAEAEADALVLTGAGGDILIFDPDVLHGATTNHSGARRRSLLISYACLSLRDQHRQTAALRNVQMEESEIFGLAQD